jgi:protein subunit release factor B
MSIDGQFAYGYLRSERGVHRLVRLSPFDSAHRRHTSFVLVEVWPDIGDDFDLEINPDDLVIDRFRASSAGGQHMQKNETAIRITHVPSGIVVACQNERSFTQNRETAMRILRARLLQLHEEERRKELDDLKGEHVDAGWGNQIRSYVLHPYQMVKDHRTDQETGNVQAVLDGNLDPFMEAYLRHTDRRGLSQSTFLGLCRDFVTARPTDQSRRFLCIKAIGGVKWPSSKAKRPQAPARANRPVNSALPHHRQGARSLPESHHRLLHDPRSQPSSRSARR